MKNILNRKNIFSSQSLGLLLIIIVIIIIINLISANHFGRLDLTEEKQYSLSNATKNTLAQIDDPLFIKIYFSENLPPDLNIVSQQLKDTLSEYRSFSKHIQIEFIDPAKDSEIEKEVNSLGIRPVEMQIIEKDEYKVQKGYLGLALFYEDKKEITPIIQNVQTMEYDLTSSIKRLIADELKVVGFLSGHDEHGLYEIPYQQPDPEAPKNDYTSVKKALDKNYQTKIVDITDGESIENVDTLIIAGPKKEITEKELYQIDQFIMKGGKVIFLIDEVEILPGLQAMARQTGIEKLINHYGVQINPDIVVASINENVPFSSGYVQFLLPYPLWPKLINENFSTEHPVMSKLQSISFAWPSSLSPIDKANIELEILASTSSRGSTISEPFNLDPQQNFAITSPEKVPMIIEAKGKFSSYYAGQQVADIVATEVEDATFLPITDEETQTVDQALEETQIIVIGDSDFISDEFLSRFKNNLTFFLNTVDYLTLDSDLIDIRAKTINDRPLEEISEGSKRWVKIINIILIPLLIIIIGVAVFYKRKKNTD